MGVSRERIRRVIMVTKTISKCAGCGYPLAAEYSGQTVSCPMCGITNIAQGVTIPTPIFAGGLGLLLGIFLGPALLAGSEWGREYLVNRARGG